jgi:hypothetical protein
VEIEVLEIFGGAFDPLSRVGLVDDILRHELHGDEVDVRDLVIAGANRVEGSHVSRDMPVDVHPQLVRFRRCWSDPGRIH